MRMIEAETSATAVAQKLVERSSADLASVETAVGRIVADVRRDGDSALRRYAGKLDGLAPGQPLRVAPEEIKSAWESVPQDFKAALKEAAGNIRQFCKWQKPREWMRSMRPGLRVGQLVRPLDAVGCYVPGGRYPLPSTLLMTVIPAQVAGVKQITVVSPR